MDINRRSDDLSKIEDFGSKQFLKSGHAPALKIKLFEKEEEKKLSQSFVS